MCLIRVEITPVYGDSGLFYSDKDFDIRRFWYVCAVEFTKSAVNKHIELSVVVVFIFVHVAINAWFIGNGSIVILIRMPDKTSELILVSQHVNQFFGPFVCSITINIAIADYQCRKSSPANQRVARQSTRASGESTSAIGSLSAKRTRLSTGLTLVSCGVVEWSSFSGADVLCTC